jgi:hypothetical protein
MYMNIYAHLDVYEYICIYTILGKGEKLIQPLLDEITIYAHIYIGVYYTHSYNMNRYVYIYIYIYIFQVRGRS